MYVITVIILQLFFAFGIYNIAKKLKISKAWLGFVPIINLYILGCIATYNYENNLRKRWMTHISWISYVTYIISLFMYVIFVAQTLIILIVGIVNVIYMYRVCKTLQVNPIIGIIFTLFGYEALVYFYLGLKKEKKYLDSSH